MTTPHHDQTANTRKKNPHAVALGRKGGLKGGPVRMAQLDKAQRHELALKGYAAGIGRKRQQNPLENNPKIIAQST